MNRMSGLPAWSAVYAAFDDVALEALANRGLVRRGRAEVAAGRVGVQEAGRPTGSASEMVAESTETLTVAVGRPAVPVVLTADGPQEARCPCPVAGICVHVVAACLWMREALAAEASAEPDPGGPAADGDDEDPVLAEVLAWEPAVVEKTVGVAALRRVTAALAGTDPDILAADTLVTRAPGRLSVTWPNAPGAQGNDRRRPPRPGDSCRLASPGRCASLRPGGQGLALADPKDCPVRRSAPIARLRRRRGRGPYRRRYLSCRPPQCR